MALDTFMEKKEPQGEAKSGAGDCPAQGQGRLKSETSCRARVPEGWGRAGGPRVSWGLGPFVLGVDLA